jgi:hypothetical protein
MSGRRAVKRVSRSLPDAPQRAIYDGRQLLGSVLQRGQDYVAIDQRGRPISTHDSFLEAATAVTKHSGGGD